MTYTGIIASPIDYYGKEGSTFNRSKYLCETSFQFDMVCQSMMYMTSPQIDYIHPLIQVMEEYCQ